MEGVSYHSLLGEDFKDFCKKTMTEEDYLTAVNDAHLYPFLKSKLRKKMLKLYADLMDDYIYSLYKHDLINNGMNLLTKYYPKYYELYA